MNFERKEYLSIMAKAPSDDFIFAFRNLGVNPEYKVLRPAEIGTVMARGRMGATGDQFNLGEIVVTRASIELETGEIGHGFVQGRHKEHAKMVALCDAMMQREEFMKTIGPMIADLKAQQDLSHKQRAAEAAKTKVDFFTMVRGENE